jgi:signal transduction histidine kinase
MDARPGFALLKRVPAGVWTAVVWCLATAVLFRGYLGIPGMPHGLPPLSLGDWLLAATAMGMGLAGSRLLGQRPVAALGLVIAGSFAAALAVNSAEIVYLHYVAIDVALGCIVATRSRRVGVAAFVLALGVLPGYAITRSLLDLPLEPAAGRGLHPGTAGSWAGWQLFSALAVVAWLIGNSVRQTRDYARRLSARAAAQAVTTERLRIARELHDMVAHSIGIIALQSGAAKRVIDTQPDEARRALGEVELASRETLSGLRRMLGALRQAEPGQGPQASPVGPMPGLADVDQLAEQTTAAGVRVDVRWRGRPRPLPPEIDVSAYRVIQEAVTNVVRHARARSCQVSIDCRGEEIAIEVLDSGNGRGSGAAAGNGYGLVGMRERVGLLHGDFSAGPRPEGGFRVAARLPVPTATR